MVCTWKRFSGCKLKIRLWWERWRDYKYFRPPFALWCYKEKPAKNENKNHENLFRLCLVPDGLRLHFVVVFFLLCAPWLVGFFGKGSEESILLQTSVIISGLIVYILYPVLVFRVFRINTLEFLETQWSPLLESMIKGIPKYGHCGRASIWKILLPPTMYPHNADVFQWHYRGSPQHSTLRAAVADQFLRDDSRKYYEVTKLKVFPRFVYLWCFPAVGSFLTMLTWLICFCFQLGITQQSAGTLCAITVIWACYIFFFITRTVPHFLDWIDFEEIQWRYLPPPIASGIEDIGFYIADQYGTFFQEANIWFNILFLVVSGVFLLVFSGSIHNLGK